MAVRFRTQRDVNALLDKQNKRRRALAVSCSVALVVGLGLLFWAVNIFIAEKEEASFIVYQPEEDPGPKMAQKKEMASNVRPAQPKIDIIAADSTADVSFVMDVEIDVDGLSMDYDLTDGLAGGDGLGEGMGEGGGSGMGSGKKTENAFEGRFWDFKKSSGGSGSKLKSERGDRATSSKDAEVLALISRFYNNGWNITPFTPYYESKTRLYTSCFYMPNCRDGEACAAYDPNGKMGLAPARWVALYRAKVQAPKSGRFRFFGIADSNMAVRFNGKNVLSCGIHDLPRNISRGGNVLMNPSCLDGKDVVAYEACNEWNKNMGGFVSGEPFEVKAGEWYEMQVLVTEIGGGYFGFCLLIDDMNEEIVKATEDGKPLLQLFRTSFIAPNADEIYAGVKETNKDESMMTRPPYDEDSMVWPAKPLKVGAKAK